MENDTKITSTEQEQNKLLFKLLLNYISWREGATSQLPTRVINWRDFTSFLGDDFLLVKRRALKNMV
jgi:hypothetical protein